MFILCQNVYPKAKYLHVFKQTFKIDFWYVVNGDLNDHMPMLYLPQVLYNIKK